MFVHCLRFDSEKVWQHCMCIPCAVQSYLSYTNVICDGNKVLPEQRCGITSLHTEEEPNSGTRNKTFLFKQVFVNSITCLKNNNKITEDNKKPILCWSLVQPNAQT